MIFIIFLIFVTAVVFVTIFTDKPEPEEVESLDRYIHLYEVIESHLRLGIISETDRAELIKTLDTEVLKSAEEHLKRLENDVIK